MDNPGIKKKEKGTFSRFGYIMVAAGAAIGLGNIWKFPYLAYAGGGGAFIVVYIILCIVLGHPVILMETAVGRFGKSNAIDAYGNINKKWKIVGIVNVICTVMIDMYYIIVSGYVLKYAVQYLVSGNFGKDNGVFYTNFISSPVAPIIYAAILMAVIVLLLSFGITELVEKVTKVIMPVLFVLLVICGVWALFVAPGALKGLKFYLVPEFSNFTFKTGFADAAVQVMFSVGIGWAIFTTLGASMSDDKNIRRDSTWVDVCDTSVALLAGFVIIPAVVGGGSKMSAGPSLIFNAMTEIFSKFPGGRIIGFFFFAAVLLAVLSTYFTILEIPAKVVEEKFHIKHNLATVITAVFIMIGGVFCSLSQGNGLLSGVKIPFPMVSGMAYYNIYDWFDCVSGYILLPLGCLLTTIFCGYVWKDGFEKEQFKGSNHKLNTYDKVVMKFVVPILTLLVVLNCFGFIK
ncbi:MAG: sodium-dependent transporter [Lachnospiraceae bacterium]|nr:sodium-dependent transporter [Lachnospiraceae bacterium]